MVLLVLVKTSAIVWGKVSQQTFVCWSTCFHFDKTLSHIPLSSGVEIQDNACLGTQPCSFLGDNVTVANGSCLKNFACSELGGSVEVGEGSCDGDAACRQLGAGVKVGNDACQGDRACCGADMASLAVKGFIG